MNKIYLVCTRSAITASALTYIINSSPDCYNLSHNNLWLYEESECFGTAHIINDWWNVSDHLKSNGYDVNFRNDDELVVDQLLEISATWQEMNTGKDICLFTHARNVREIMQYRDQYQLPIVVITTYMGAGCHNFIDGVLRREYNPQMNQYIDIASAWDHIYNQITVQDEFWTAHSDVSFKMQDWLRDTPKIYKELGIAANPNIKLWCDQYMLFNSISEEFETAHGVLYETKRIAYKIQLYVYLVQRYGETLSRHQKRLFAEALPEIHNRKVKVYGIDDFAAAAMELAGLPLDIINSLVYSQS